jgi:hypothetical protein
MNNQLPEHNWKFKLYSYSSPVDKGLLRKVLDAKNKNGDQPLSFWLILSILLIFISGSLVLIDSRIPDTNTIKNVPVPTEALQQEPDKAISGTEPALPGRFEHKQLKKSKHVVDGPSTTGNNNETKQFLPTDPDTYEKNREKLSMENTVQENQLSLNLLICLIRVVTPMANPGKQYPAGILATSQRYPHPSPFRFSPMEGRRCRFDNNAKDIFI